MRIPRSGRRARRCTAADRRCGERRSCPRLDGARALEAACDRAKGGRGALAAGRRRRADDGEQSRRRADRPIDPPIRTPAVRQHARMRHRWRGLAGCRDIAHCVSRCGIGRPMNDEAVRDLARRAGIAVEWHDHAGRPAGRARPTCCATSSRRSACHAATRGDLLASRRLLAAQVQCAGAAAADHRDGGPTDPARRRGERTATRAAQTRDRRAARHLDCCRCADGCACRRSASPAIIAC